MLVYSVQDSASEFNIMVSVKTVHSLVTDYPSIKQILLRVSPCQQILPLPPPFPHHPQAIVIYCVFQLLTPSHGSYFSYYGGHLEVGSEIFHLNSKEVVSNTKKKKPYFHYKFSTMQKDLLIFGKVFLLSSCLIVYGITNVSCHIHYHHHSYKDFIL